MHSRVSVIIPTYNRSRFLREAIQSVLRQTHRPAEIIVVDDGSRDDTDSVVEEFGDRVRCLRCAHRGVSAARNVGIRQSCGRWLAFLDSDDLWLPGKLSAQTSFVERNRSFRILQTDEIWMRNGKRINRRTYHEKPEGYCFEKLLDRCLVSPSAVMVERSLLDETGYFDEEMVACEDYDLWLRIGCRHPIGLVKESLVVKRGGHPDQLSSTVPTLDRYRILALEKILLSGRLTREQSLQALRVLEIKCRVYGQGCRKRGNEEEASRVLSLPDMLSTAVLGVSASVRPGNAVL
jgi:glycosyltransferase involved in cell wall biosynthesis